MNNIFSEEFIYDESDEFMRMNRKTYNLPVDVLIDQEFICKCNHHEPIIYFRNSYNPYEHNYVPLSISIDPVVLSDKEINITVDDLSIIKSWVSKYWRYLICISKGLIDWHELYKIAAVKPNKEICDRYNSDEM